jgi:chromosomal replication initiation ATPase DnaA
MRVQLLPIKSKDDYSLHKWITAPCNDLASRWVIEGVKTSNMAYIYGELGKTHLAHMFAYLHGGRVIGAPSEPPRQLLTRLNPFAEDLGNAHLKEDATLKNRATTHAIAIDPVENFDERWLFDAFNILKESCSYVLFTSRQPAQHFELQDLRSRMMSLLSFKLERPDDHTIKSVIAKRLKDQGALVDEGTLTYLLERIPRSFAAVNEWVEKLDTYSSIHKCRISKNVVRFLLQGDAF